MRSCKRSPISRAVHRSKRAPKPKAIPVVTAGDWADGADALNAEAVVVTNRLALRRLTIADAPFMLALLNEPSFHVFIGDRGVRTVADAEVYLQNGALASYVTNGFGLYLVALRDSGTAIGICGLVRREGLDDADIGFAYHPAYWGQGYADEAAHGVLQHARQHLGLQRVAAITNPDNARSVRLLEKLGLKFIRKLQLTADASVVSLYLGDL